MPALFSALAAAAGATVDAGFGEAFLFEPMAPPPPPAGCRANVNLCPVASTARTPLPFEGTYVAPGDLMNAHGRTKADSTTHPIAGEKALVDVAAGALPQRPQAGDRIHRLDTGEVFEVAKVLPGDVGRLRIYLAALIERGAARPRRRPTFSHPQP